MWHPFKKYHLICSLMQLLLLRYLLLHLKVPKSMDVLYAGVRQGPWVYLQGSCLCSISTWNAFLPLSILPNNGTVYSVGLFSFLQFHLNGNLSKHNQPRSTNDFITNPRGKSATSSRHMSGTLHLRCPKLGGR